VLTGLADSNLVILRAIVESRELFVKAIYQRYRRISIAVGAEPFSYVHFYASLSHLRSTGLVLLVSTKVGRACTNQLQLLFDRELLDSTWSARFG
jgi:Cdc6-like AAA superfamily ATPase